MIHVFYLLVFVFFIYFYRSNPLLMADMSHGDAAKSSLKLNTQISNFEDLLYGRPLGPAELKSDGWHRSFQRCEVFVSCWAKGGKRLFYIAL